MGSPGRNNQRNRRSSNSNSGGGAGGGVAGMLDSLAGMVGLRGHSMRIPGLFMFSTTVLYVHHNSTGRTNHIITTFCNN